MKILSVAPGILGDDAASWRIWNIARLLQLGGHDVHLLRFVRTVDKERLGGALDLNNLSNSIITASIPTVHIKLLREITRGNYDLVYGNTHIGAFCSLLGRLTRVPLVFDMHGGLVEELLLSSESKSLWARSASVFELLLDKVIDYSVRHFPSKIMCVSRKMIQYLHEMRGVPLGKMAYIANGVDLHLFKPQAADAVSRLRRELGLEKKLVFGYVGGFARWQGVENFIQAARMMDSPEFAFVIVGAGEKSSEGNILFIPRVPRDQLLGYYSMCDILVLPRPSHPAVEIAAPTKFAEYTAMARPVLTTNVADAAELVKEYHCGVVVKDNTPRSLKEGIVQFRELPEDSLNEMGQASRRLAENEFDWGKVSVNLLNVLAELAKLKGH